MTSDDKYRPLLLTNVCNKFLAPSLPLFKDPNLNVKVLLMSEEYIMNVMRKIHIYKILLYQGEHIYI